MESQLYNPEAGRDRDRRRRRLLGADGARRGRRARALREIRDRIMDPLIAAHDGTVVKTAGDGMLITFASATEAYGVR